MAAGAIVLALLLGLVLSWSLIGPIQRIDSRLAAIASGDFSGHVDVTNRDELGALGANVNRMNDELKRLYRELETASRHKSEFLANMSHELRTPLNAIIGFSQVLRERMFGEVNEKQEEYLDDIISSGNHLLSLINDVLDLSKVEAGQVELEVAPFSLREALESGVAMVRERATEDGVRLALEPAPDVDVVEGDERRIRQVVFNLLSNAVKFTPEGGSVDRERGAGERRGARLGLGHGPGIAAEDHGGSSRSSSRPCNEAGNPKEVSEDVEAAHRQEIHLRACSRCRRAGRARVLRTGCILAEPGGPKDEGIPRDKGLLGTHRARGRLLHDQVLERQGAQGGLEDLLRPVAEFDRAAQRHSHLREAGQRRNRPLPPPFHDRGRTVHDLGRHGNT